MKRSKRANRRFRRTATSSQSYSFSTMAAMFQTPTMSQKLAGVTLTELLITVAVLGILTALASPSYQDMLERHRLKEVVESLKADMQLARSEAIKRSTNVTVSKSIGDAGTWCYGLTLSSSCDCHIIDDCEIKTVTGTNFSAAVNMDSTSPTDHSFNFRRGTVQAGNVTFSTKNYLSKVIMSNTGRIRICTPSGANGLPGYPKPCS